MSVTNIDEYSSGDSEDPIKNPRIQRRRNALVGNSISGSELDLLNACYQGSDSAHTFRPTKLSDSNRAVSCSDLMLEFTERKPQVRAATLK